MRIGRSRELLSFSCCFLESKESPCLNHTPFTGTYGSGMIEHAESFPNLDIIEEALLRPTLLV